MTDLTWAGTIAGALIAIATVLHWAITRAIRLGTWLAGAVELPTEVARLAVATTELTGAVQQLALTCQPHPDHAEVTR